MLPAFGSYEFSCVLEAAGTPPFLCSLAVFGGSVEGYVTELFFGKQPRSTPGSANMGILRRIVRIT